MQETWRWFGPDDPVTLADVRQAGASGIVTALHDVPNGGLWPVEAIEARKAMIEEAGLQWSVVESIPLHEDIKTGAPGWREYAGIWAENLKRLARAGVTTICYNFMPVLDWTRTDLDYELPNGARCLRFDHLRFAAFDLYMLGRKGAEADYPAETREAARAVYEAMSADDRELLTNNIIAGLPGSEESYTLDGFRQQLAAYDGLGPDDLRTQLAEFLKIVIPVAEEEGAILGIHPDDPPRSLFGLPRIVSCLEDLKAIGAMVDSPANGFTLCAGSLGVRADNDVPAMIRELGDRIHFLHLRTTKRGENPLDFHEADHLAGDVDMVAAVREAVLLERRTGRILPFRPDHGHQLLSDLRVVSTPGYPAIGRLRGLAELRGVEAAVNALL